MNKLDKFEEMMRNSLDNHEVAYDPSQWNSLNKKLGKSKGGSTITWLAVASVAVIITGGVFIYNMVTDNNSGSTSTLTEVENPTTNSDNKENNILVPINDENNSEIESNTNLNNNLENNNSTQVNIEKNNTINKTDVTDVKKVNDIEVLQNNVKIDLQENHNQIATKLPIPSFKISTSEICSGEKVQLLVKNLPENAECVWMINNEKIANKSSEFEYTFKESGNYSISLVFAKGKQTSEITEQTVFVKALNPIDFTFEKEITEGKPYMNFKPIGDASNFMWTFEDGTTSEEKPSKFFRHKGVYVVKLSAEGTNGCATTVTKGLEIEEEYNLFAPTTFTPNGDGLNDVFIPVALTVMDVDFTMSIFTREGKLVYQTNSANRPWDGKFTSDNQNAPLGAYVWVVSIKGEEAYKGSITLMP